MDMSSARRVPASREAVWLALNDPDTLKQCVAGCERFEAVGDNAYQITMVSKIGSIRTRFNGKLLVADSNPPESYTLVFEGEGGMAGFAKGRAQVTLSVEGVETLLAYTANAQIGGKLAQIGSRLLDAAAGKMADEFFAAFVRRLSEGAVEPGASASAEAEDTVIGTGRAKEEGA
ncbi:SRPBCC family protein [Noviherbaspirillum galbum]|uniref:Carbon monoxide dehydrogenase subunit G n=1 Tax=Noviherbaspirillum galbum TaxID=2709383 RepID=A0A6B3STP4_9BURK|nr:carbon monoxide dehydrogenase subunit G [Noviherbaspirillum galbum]NEX64163.1 carbon monoxide dehydrogenase subunit G [Noviherbaspirillum galbum]